MTVGRRSQTLVLAVLSLVALRPSLGQDQPAKVSVQWDKVTRVSKTTPTLQVVVNPPLRRGSAIHDNAFKSLRDLQADYGPASHTRLEGDTITLRGFGVAVVTLP